MDISDVIALCFGIIGAISGGVGLVFARRSATASEKSADASEVSAKAAVNSVEFQVGTHRHQISADVVFAHIAGARHILLQRNEARDVTFIFNVFNRGPSVAHDLALLLKIDDTHAYVKTMVVLLAQQAQRIEIAVPKHVLAKFTDRDIPVELRYLDGNGRRVKTSTISVFEPEVIEPKKFRFEMPHLSESSLTEPPTAGSE